MSTDEHNNVSTQLRQAAQLLNKNNQLQSETLSTDSEVHSGKPKVKTAKDVYQAHSADSDVS